VGNITALTILAAIGDISRFPSSKQLVGYAGLGSRVHDSGMTRTTGRITKTGRLMHAAWQLPCSSMPTGSRSRT
jgi:transposase